MVEHNQSANVPSGVGYDNKWKFNGKELDDATQMYYYGARYYDPRISIFVSVDPLAEKYPAMNPFAYTDNNPINAIDPDGRDKIFINSSGSIIKIVNDGKKDIVIIDHNGNRNSLSSYKFNSTGSYFSNNNYNRQVVANVVGYYL